MVMISSEVALAAEVVPAEEVIQEEYGTPSDISTICAIAKCQRQLSQLALSQLGWQLLLSLLTAISSEFTDAGGSIMWWTVICTQGSGSGSGRCSLLHIPGFQMDGRRRWSLLATSLIRRNCDRKRMQ